MAKYIAYGAEEREIPEESLKKKVVFDHFGSEFLMATRFYWKLFAGVSDVCLQVHQK